MLSTRGARPWDLDSVSSQTSDATSRATTVYSPSEGSIPIRSGTDRSNRSVTQSNRSSSPTTTADSANTVITRNQQQPWVNPYWGSSSKSNAAGTNASTVSKDSSSTRVQQIIPGSIMIDDRGEIDNLSRKWNTSENNASLGSTHTQRHIVTTPSGAQRSSSSSNALNNFRPTFDRQQTFPQTNDKNIQPWVNPYWSQTNSQSKPTDNRYQGATNAPKSTTSNETWKNPYWKDWKPQTSTTSGEQSKPWVNPYWKDWKAQTETTSGQPNKPWVNPYWKPQTSTTSGQQNKSWVNPYWKDWKPQTSTTSDQQSKPWVNPYWKDQKPQTATTSGQQNKPWVNPYWKDKNTSDEKANESVNNRFSSYGYSASAVPDFYERIYPLHTPTISPVPIMELTDSNTISTSALNQGMADDEEPPFTIDSQGTAHYRVPSSSAANTNQTKTFPPSSPPSQYPVSPPNPPNISEPFSQTSYTTSTPKAANNVSFSPINASCSVVPNSSTILDYSSLTSTSGHVLTEEDLKSIQYALQSLATNSNAIRVVEAPNDILSFDSNYPNSSFSFPHTTGEPSYFQQSNPSGSAPHSGNNSSSLSALFSGNPLQQPSQQQTSTTHPEKHSSPLAALFSGNPLQQPSQQQTSTAHPEKHSSPLAALFSGNPSQQPSQQQTNTAHPEKHSSPLAALFSGNPLQPSNQQQTSTAQPEKHSSSFGGLFSGNPLHQSNQQQTSTAHSAKRLSPLSILFDRQEGKPSAQQHSIPSSNVVFLDDRTSPLSTFFNKTPMDHSIQSQFLPSSFSSPPMTTHTSRPYSYDLNAQQLSVYYTPNYIPVPDQSSHTRITQKPVVFI